MSQLVLESVQNLDITAKRGDTFEFNINVKDTDGADYAFTTHTGKMEVKTDNASAVPSPTTVLTLNSSANEIVFSTGRIALIKNHLNMSFDPGDYYYDLQITMPDLKVKTWLQGSFTLTEEITT